MTWILSFIVVIMALHSYLFSDYTNFQIAGVSLLEEDAHSSEMRRLIGRYRRRILLVSILLIIFIFATPYFWTRELEIILVPLMFIIIFVYPLLTGHFRREVKSFKQERIDKYPDTRRIIDLNVSAGVGENIVSPLWVWAGWAVLWIPVLIEILIGEYNWHFVVLPLAMIILPLTYKQSVTYSINGLYEETEETLAYYRDYEYKRSRLYVITMWMSSLFLLGMYWVTKNPPYRFWLYIMIALFLIGVLAIFTAMIGLNRQAPGGSPSRLSNPQRDDYHWWGYNNPNDPRIMVPKHVGIGTTINAGHPVGRIIYIVLTVGLVIMMGFLFWTMSTHYEITVDSEAITITAPLYNSEIEIEDIDEVRLQPFQGDKLIRTSGYGGTVFIYGNFAHADYGDIRIYLNREVPEEIYIEQDNGFIHLLNLDSLEETQDLYEEILELVYN